MVLAFGLLCALMLAPESGAAAAEAKPEDAASKIVKLDSFRKK